VRARAARSRPSPSASARACSASWRCRRRPTARTRSSITVGQVFYLLNSRFLLDSSLSITAHLGNRYLPLGIGAVAVLQVLFTYAPPLQSLFDNEAIPLWIWPWLFLGGLVFFLFVEIEKLVIRSVEPLRRTVTAVEAGT
jgi:hypothetical protein